MHCCASISAEVKQLERRCTLPGMSVVVVGNTGAGKSTLLNALIGERSALPTNGMRACTAVLAELSWGEEDGYVGEVEFLSREVSSSQSSSLMQTLLECVRLLHTVTCTATHCLDHLHASSGYMLVRLSILTLHLEAVANGWPAITSPKH